MLPASRPAEAPPREVAGEPDASKPNGNEADPAPQPAAQKAPVVNPPKKKRRQTGAFQIFR
jgi:hypothetical protein